MATDLLAAPVAPARRAMRWPMSPVHGVRAVLVAGATAVAGDHSVVVAIITACGGVTAVVVGPFVTEYIRSRRRQPVDHYGEHVAEQAALVDHLVSEIARLERDNERLKRRRRD